MPVIRELEAKILDYIRSAEPQNNTLLLSGARQVGKSSLIQNLLQGQNALFINLFELPTFVERIDQTQSFAELEKLLLLEFGFSPGAGRLLVIDEAQESKILGKWIRFFKEKWRHQKVIVLGSILSQLFAGENNYPVGRVTEITLRPFNFKEFLLAIGQTGQRDYLNHFTLKTKMSPTDLQSFADSYLKYLQLGGMPDVVIRSEQKRESPVFLWGQLLRQYAMDVERCLGENFKSLFLAAAKRIAELTCQPAKNSEIVATDSPFYRKVPLLIEVLEKWHLVLKTHVKTKQPEAGSGHASKKYLFDVGLTNFLLTQSKLPRWQDRSQLENLVYGKLQENFVMTELIALKASPETGLQYYKDNRNSKEVDALINLGDKTVPLEVKSQTTINRNGLAPMTNFLEQTRGSQGVLIYNGLPTTLQHHGKTIVALPAFLTSEIPRLFSLAPHHKIL